MDQLILNLIRNSSQRTPGDGSNQYKHEKKIKFIFSIEIDDFLNVYSLQLIFIDTVVHRTSKNWTQKFQPNHENLFLIEFNQWSRARNQPKWW